MAAVRRRSQSRAWSRNCLTMRAMSNDELERLVNKEMVLLELRRARERVLQLERKLRGEPATQRETSHLPEFLRLQQQ